MNQLEIKDRTECSWDCISLGEVMLRFDPGDDRIHTARNFRVFEGGGEYNVARNLASVFHKRTAIVTALADNEIGRLLEGLIREGGVDASEILWRYTDGISREVRNGLYFMERGFGMRSPVGSSDRGNTAVSKLAAGDIAWNRIFSKGVRWFHTGGIFTGLSDTTPAAALGAMKAARENNTLVSYDLNFRGSLWNDRGGRDAANKLNAEFLPFVDVVFGLDNFSPGLNEYDEPKFRDAADAMISRFPNIRVIATTLRDVHSASRHDLGAAVYFDGQVYKAENMTGIEVYDRVGSGDAFAAGLIYGFLSGCDIDTGSSYALANAALTMTSPGDWSTATLSEVKKAAGRGDRNVQR